MTHSRPFAVVISSLLSIGLLFHPSGFSAAEAEKPKEPAQKNDLAGDAAQLRKEVEMLRQRVEHLEKMRSPAVRERHDGDTGERDRLLAETRQILTQFQDAKADVWKQAHGKIRGMRQQLAASLTELQDGYTRRAKLDEAVAIRDAICFIKDPARSVLTDPAVLRNTGAASRILFFRVTGANSGSVYGTNVYTYDSALATASVHAGVLKMGQTGIVKVITVPSHPGYVSSTRNGITSSSWSSYPGYRVEALGDEDQDLNDGDTGNAAGTKSPRPPLCAPAPGNDSLNDAPKEDPRPQSSDQPATRTPDMPASLPAEAREQICHFTTAAADIRKSARTLVFHLTRETADRLAPIQDAHTRAARLDEAIIVRDMIRKLTECTDKP